jgi:hypothetical protein
MKVHLVWDTSGSMGELGKLWIARSVARAIEQYNRLGYFRADLRLIAWGREARALDWNSDQEFPPELLVPTGSVNAKALISLCPAEPDSKIALLTDGFWTPADAREIRLWRENLPPDNLRVIKIGADANPRLKGSDVFSAEDFFAALDGWLEGGAR